MREFIDYEKMAMLDLSDTERSCLKERFDEIIGGFSALDAFDTSDVEPLVSVLDIHNVMREDISSKSISREKLLENAPEQREGYFVVPAAID